MSLSSQIEKKEQGLSSGKRIHSLIEFYNEVTANEYINPTRTYQLFDDILDQIDQYTAPIPDYWHNTVLIAARIKHYEAQLAIIHSGLQEWPDNVDLLCDELQLRYTDLFNSEEAQLIWERLTKLDIQKISHNWRFWVYGAIYQVRVLHQNQAALQLLDEGVRRVKREQLVNLIKGYREVFINTIPDQEFNDIEAIKSHQREMLALVAERYKLGMMFVFEDAYILAYDLAQLYQDLISITIQENSLDSTDNFQSDYLQQAFYYLNLAEQLYTGNTNYPIWYIYLAKARILVVRRQYNEAVKLLGSLPRRVRQNDESISSMLSFASSMIGKALEEEGSYSKDILTQKSINEVLLEVLSDVDRLHLLASEKKEISITLFKVIRRLQKGLEG